MDERVRIGTPADVDDAMAVIMQCHEENGFVEADTGKILGDLWAALNLEEGITGLIGGQGKPLEGCVVLRMGTIGYSKVVLVEEKMLFVHKDYRRVRVGPERRSHALMLGEFSKKVADDLHKILLIGVLSNHRTKAKVRLYESMFGEPAGAFFLYGAKTGHATVGGP